MNYLPIQVQLTKLKMKHKTELPLTSKKILKLLPGPDTAPYATHALELTGREDGGFDAHLALRFDDVETSSGESRITAWLDNLGAEAPPGHTVEPQEDGVIVHFRFEIEGEGR